MQQQTEEHDTAWGVRQIAAVIGRNERVTYYLLEKGELPSAKKVAGRWQASRRRLRAFLEGDAA